MKQKLIFLAGSSFSGSTLLGGMLAPEQCAYLGELDRLRTFARHEENYLLDACTICSSKGIDCGTFSTQPAATLLQSYLEILRRHQGLVCDGSKAVDWLKDLLASGLRQHVDVYAIITSRNPIAFSYSNSEATNSPYWQSAISWREIYTHTLRVLTTFKIPFINARYEQLFDPAALTELSEALSSMTGTELMLDPVNIRGTTHMLGGNLGVYLYNQNCNLEAAMAMKEFTSEDTWKVDYYKNRKLCESKRWAAIGKEEALQLLQIPGIVDMMTLLGYSLEETLRYFE